MPTTGKGNSARTVRDKTPGPWTKWRRMSRHARAIKFMSTYCRLPKGVGWGKPMHLAPWQKEMLEEILAPGIGAAVRSFPRGNGKSSFSAGLGTWATFDENEDNGAPSVPIVATTVGQAIRSIYGVIDDMVAAEPELANRSIVFSGAATPKVYVPSNGGECYPIANAFDGLQGLDPTVAIMDEVGFQPFGAWNALIQASGKRPSSLVFGCGTPGVDRDNALWELRTRVKDGIELPGFSYREWAADPGCDIRDRAQWRKGNPALRSGFLRISALDMDLHLVPEASFRIFRLGQWADGHQNWLGQDGRGTWDHLIDHFDFVDGAPTWMGVDAALTRDTTAVVMVQIRPDGRMHAIAKVWTPTTDEPVDLNDVMAYIRAMSKRYKVGAVAYDPRFMDWPARVLLDEGIPMVELPQSVERMTGVIGDLYTVIREGQLTHEKDELFASHVMNAIARPNDRGFTLSKGKSRGHIDAAIALGLAVDRVRNKRTRAALVAL